MNQKRLNALIKGCEATTTETVTIETAHAYEVLGRDTCEINNLFNWSVDAEANTRSTKKPGSVIPENAGQRVFGLSEVNRELFLELLLEVQKQQAYMTKGRIDSSFLSALDASVKAPIRPSPTAPKPSDSFVPILKPNEKPL